MELILDEGIVDYILEVLAEESARCLSSKAAEIEAIRDIIIEQLPE